MQYHKSIPCWRAKDCEEGFEDPKNQGKAGWKELKLGAIVFDGKFWSLIEQTMELGKCDVKVLKIGFVFYSWGYSRA